MYNYLSQSLGTQILLCTWSQKIKVCVLTLIAFRQPTPVEITLVRQTLIRRTFRFENLSHEVLNFELKSTITFSLLTRSREPEPVLFCTLLLFERYRYLSSMSSVFVNNQQMIEWQTDGYLLQSFISGDTKQNKKIIK